MTPEESTRIVGYMLAAFRPRDWSDASSAVYIEVLAELNYERAMQAARYLVRGEKFMPAVAELLTEYADLYDPAAVLYPMLAETGTTLSTIGAMTNDEVAAFAAETRRLLDEAGPRLPKMPEMTAEQIRREGQALPEYDPGPGPIQGTYDPIQAINGPPCPMHDTPTAHNGGDLWFCRECGWVTRRFWLSS